MPSKLSPECQDMLKRMIEIDPSKRISALDAMQHPFIKNKGGEQKNNINEEE